MFIGLPPRLIFIFFYFKGELNTEISPQKFWTTFLDDSTEKFKKSAVVNAIAIPLPLCFSYFVPLRRFRENLTKPFYFYLSRTCDYPVGIPSVISLALSTNTSKSENAGTPQSTFKYVGYVDAFVRDMMRRSRHEAIRALHTCRAQTTRFGLLYRNILIYCID